MIPPIAGRTTKKTYHSLVQLLKAPEPPAPSTSAVPDADSDSVPDPVPPGTQRCPHCHGLIPAIPATGGMLSLLQLLKAQRDASAASTSSSAVPADTPAAPPRPVATPAIPTPPDSDAEPELRVQAPDPNPMSPALTDPAVPSVLAIPIPRAPIPEFSKSPDPPTPPSTDDVTPPLPAGIPAISLPPTPIPGQLLKTPDPSTPLPTDPSAPPLPAGIRCTAHVQILPADDPPIPPSPSASTDPAALPFPPSASLAPSSPLLAGIPPALLQVALRAAADEEQRLALQAALEASLPAALQVALQAALQAALPPLLTKLEDKIDDWRRFERKSYNRALGDGSAIPFEPVPFPDGTLPSANPSVSSHLPFSVFLLLIHETIID
ncbi:hypothetical protein B0H14DRAFT_1426442 [Mycena olivaceomarginata]|nr:hypothetical protein B0H14DRAFT_1426442 [Mycena olivaceomarginata]